MLILAVPTFPKKKYGPKQAQDSLWTVTAKSLATEAHTMNLCITLIHQRHAKDIPRGQSNVHLLHRMKYGTL